MISILTVVRYPRWMSWAGFLSMAFFRLPLLFSKKIRFWKLMGCGKNGTFDIYPDLLQWALLINTEIAQEPVIPEIINSWWKFFRCEVWTIKMEPIEGHGTWDGKECFGNLPKQTEYDDRIGILTRATIRLNKLRSFWKNVDQVALKMAGAEGFITSLGIGEIPWIKQATFSIWESKTLMRNFAYQSQEHAEVIRKTKKEDWYSEDMFVRFRIISSTGTLQGKDPLKRN